MILLTKPDILEFNTNYCIMQDLRIRTPKEIIILSVAEDFGKKDKLISKLLNYEEYIIICSN